MSEPLPPDIRPFDLPDRALYEVVFSDQSMQALNRLALPEQMRLVETISSVTSAQLRQPDESLAHFRREGHTFYRIRAGEYRFYFEIQGARLLCHHILHRNSLVDFIYRNRLPVTEESFAENQNSFWKYLESLKK